jgi:hypothetical protein
LRSVTRDLKGLKLKERAGMECILCGKTAIDRTDGLCSRECETKSQQKKYKIVRIFYEGYPDKTIKRGLSLEEARSWCSDPETSSSTAKSKKAQAIFAKYGEWYDGFAEDKSDDN